MAAVKRYSLSVADVADALGCSAKEVYRKCERREIAHLRTDGKLSSRVLHGRRQTFRVTGRIRFAPEDVAAYQAAHRVEAVAVDLPVVQPTSLVPLPTPARRRFA